MILTVSVILQRHNAVDWLKTEDKGEESGVHYDFLKSEDTVTGERYGLPINRLVVKNPIKNILCLMGMVKIPVSLILQCHNAKEHNSSVPCQTINELQCQNLPHIRRIFHLTIITFLALYIRD